jgi:hypothetical protein
MLALLIDCIVAALLVRFVPPGWKRLLFGLLGGWLAAIADAALFGGTPLDMLSKMTVGLLVHPLIIAGLVWLFEKLRSRGKRQDESG